MTQPESTVNISDIFKAFRSLENAYCYFGDVLVGFYHAGLTPDDVVIVDPETKSDLDFVIAPKANGDICDTVPWCFHGSIDYIKLVESITNKAAAVAEALKELLDSKEIEGVEFMAGSVPGWPYKDKHQK